METKGKILVTDAQMRSSLAVIRSLGKKGLDVTAGEETRFATSFFSKYCNQKFVYPSPKSNEKAFVNSIIQLIKKEKYDIIIPVADACLKPIIENRDEISKYSKIALPPNHKFMKSHDKHSTIEIALENEVPCPKTYFDWESLSENKDKLQFPLVIKPRISSGSRGVKICHSWKELSLNYQSLEKEYGGLLVQEYIPYGGEIGVYTLFNFDSEPKALTVQQRIRSYPVSGGPSTFRRTIKNQLASEAVEIGFKLLKEMEWWGVAMVEFRIDDRDGSLKLMEVNPRFWGSLQLSILSGVDFPYLLYELFTKGDVKSNLDYEDNVYCRWLLPGDVLWFLSAPHKLKNLRTFLRHDSPDDIISRDDYGPTFGFFIASLRYLFDCDMWNFVLRR